MFIRCWSYLLICLGTIGHAFNIYVFTRPSLWSNSCARYFLAATISGIFVTLVNTPLRLLLTGYNIDPFGYSIITCKLLTFVLFWAKALTSWFIALASIDRFLCSSPSISLRSWTTVRAASWAIVIMTIAIGLMYIYVPVLYEIKTGNIRCPSNQGPFPSFNGIWNLVVFSLGPPLVMLCFGSLTIHYIRQSRKRIEPPNSQTDVQLQSQMRRRKETDRQLIRMMIVQSVYFSVTSSLISVNWIYMAVRPPLVLDALQVAKDDLFTQIVGTISVTGACTSFYLFTLSSKLFRGKLKHLFK